MLTIFLKLLAHCPLWLLHGLGGLLGWLAYALDARYRTHLQINLRTACSTVQTFHYKHLLHKSIVHHGMGLLELPAIWGRSAAQACALVREVDGWEHAQAALAAKRAIIWVTPHLGCFEVAGRYISGHLPYPLTALYKPPKLAWLEPLMQSGRKRDNALTAPANASGVKMLLKALKRGEATMILPDQTPNSEDGVIAPFFGQPAYTMSLLPRLAQATDAQVLFFFAERLGWGRGYRLHIQPMQGEFGGDPQGNAALLNQNVEALIQRAPAQYLWSYNRYKHDPAGARP